MYMPPHLHTHTHTHTHTHEFTRMHVHRHSSLELHAPVLHPPPATRHPSPPLGTSFCNSWICITVLCIGRSFQNTLGLFTELCKNILSPLQLNLPEGPGTCQALHWASCVRASSAPSFLKGQLGTPQIGTVGLGQRPDGQLLLPRRLLVLTQGPW
jgi:hypothetical protein